MEPISPASVEKLSSMHLANGLFGTSTSPRFPTLSPNWIGSVGAQSGLLSLLSSLASRASDGTKHIPADRFQPRPKVLSAGWAYSFRVRSGGNLIRFRPVAKRKAATVKRPRISTSAKENGASGVELP